MDAPAQRRNTLTLDQAAARTRQPIDLLEKALAAGDLRSLNVRDVDAWRRGVIARTVTGNSHVTVEVPPVILECGHPYGPGLVTVGYGPHPAGGRSRNYYCRTCRATTYSEPDGITERPAPPCSPPR